MKFFFEEIFLNLLYSGFFWDDFVSFEVICFIFLLDLLLENLILIFKILLVILFFFVKNFRFEFFELCKIFDILVVFLLYIFNFLLFEIVLLFLCNLIFVYIFLL